MAAQLGVIANLAQTGGLNNAQAHGYNDARVKVFADYYVIDGDEAAADTIDLFKALRAGMRVLALGLSVDTAQTSLTIDVGDDASATRYATASTALQNTGLQWFTGLIGAAGFYETGQSDGDTQIKLTTGGATMTAGNLSAFILVALD